MTAENANEINARLAAVEARLDRLEGRKPGREKRKPVNRIAFEKCMDAFASGDRKALDKYRELYRIPT